MKNATRWATTRTASKRRQKRAKRRQQKQKQKENLVCLVDNCGLTFSNLLQLGTHKYWKHGLKKDGSIREGFPESAESGTVSAPIPVELIPLGGGMLAELREHQAANGHVSNGGNGGNSEMRPMIENLIQRLQTKKAAIESTLQNLNTLLEV